jgi:hypothetical protein
MHSGIFQAINKRELMDDLDSRRVLSKLWEPMISLAEVDDVDSVVTTERPSQSTHWTSWKLGTAALIFTPASISTMEGNAVFAAFTESFEKSVKLWIGTQID